MNKSIFKKIKRSLLQSINESPSSQEQIQFMSVQDMEKNLINHMNFSNKQSPSQVIISSQQSFQKKNQSESQSINSTNKLGLTIDDSKKLPDLVMQNDKLKDEIEKLKNQRKLILSQYENVLISQKNNPEIIQTTKQKSRQYSFRKSVENAQKMISTSEKLRESQTANDKNSFKQKQLGSINQRNIRSRDSQKMNRRSSERKFGASLESRASGPKVRYSSSKQAFTTLEERFYQYCKDEMVRMNSQNTKLTLKIGQLQTEITKLHKQNQLLEQDNIRLKTLSQNLEEKLKLQTQRIGRISQQMSTTLIKKQQIVENEFKLLKTQLFEVRSIEQKLRKQLNQKDIQISSLKSEISQKNIEQKSHAQLISKNAYLQNEVNELLIRNRKISQKFRRMPIIDHLWEIKQVQYENLINLIQKQKVEVQNYSNMKSSKNKISNINPFDLTFSKEGYRN